MSSPLEVDPLVAPDAASLVSRERMMASTCTGLQNSCPSSMNHASVQRPTWAAMVSSWVRITPWP
eukprot:12494141-Heterocapsa_arctica.AAC.1